MASNADPKLLEKVDPSRRKFVRRMVTATAFAVPMFSSFSMDGLTITDANALTLANSTL